jgi:hypothetical protein
VALLSSQALADGVHVDYPYHGFYASADVGVSGPVANNNWVNFADPTVKIGIHAGWELALHKYFLLAPELNLDIIPVNTDDGNFYAQNLNYDAAFTRVRFLIGARFSARIGKAEPFLRLGFGVDYIGGHVRPPGGNPGDFSSAAFAFKPALGFQYEVAKYITVGGELAFPLGIGHSFGNTRPFFNPFGPLGDGVVSFTAFDIDFVAFVGFRI